MSKCFSSEKAIAVLQALGPDKNGIKIHFIFNLEKFVFYDRIFSALSAG